MSCECCEASVEAKLQREFLLFYSVVFQNETITSDASDHPKRQAKQKPNIEQNQYVMYRWQLSIAFAQTEFGRELQPPPFTLKSDRVPKTLP